VTRRGRATAWAQLGLALAAAACAGRPAPQTTPAVATATGPVVLDERWYLQLRMLMVPVAGVRPEQVHDSFDDARSGGRLHHAVDILAPRGTPVVAADDGRVLRLRRNTLGGITIYAVDPTDRYVYYYAHLERYAHALAEGAVVSKGQIIGYVGTTGDAPANVPHLHFQLMRRPNAARWWDGEPVDPTPYLALPGRVLKD
jgi:murein DD-endopeptidase MepM/ murein hydrolase activator NlpD